MRAHGGEILVQSSVGKGTTFMLKLPITKAVQEKRPMTETAPEQVGKKKPRVLVAEDDPDCRSAISDILRTEHEVTAVENGKEAVKWLLKEPYDLLIIDCRMPGLNGVELYKWLLDNRAELQRRVIFMTGDIFVPEIRSFLTGTKCQYITKPFAMDDFKRAVSLALTNA
jgi:DNA-binding NtrC family response regulator